MPLNVLGSDEAIDALARDVEERRSKDPSYPWWFEVRENDGAVLCGDEKDLTQEQERILIELTKRHREVAFVTGHVDLDNDTRKLVNAYLLRYSKGRRRTVATVQTSAPDRRDRIAKMIKASLRYDRQSGRV